ncbi:MAG: T3SS (YopN, CesT) and YbjN peptide-binding chaperone 1 [Actinomycetes bacterium]
MSDPTALPSFPPPPDEHPLRGRVLDALIDEGGQPSLDEDGDVVVTVNDQRMFVRCADGELPMMRVFGQWRVGETVPPDQLTRFEAANDLTTRLNLVKVGVHGDVLFVAIDILVTPEMPLRPVLTSSFGAILNTVRMWHERAGGSEGTEGSDTPAG